MWYVILQGEHGWEVVYGPADRDACQSVFDEWAAGRREGEGTPFIVGEWELKRNRFLVR